MEPYANSSGWNPGYNSWWPQATRIPDAANAQAGLHGSAPTHIPGQEHLGMAAFMPAQDQVTAAQVAMGGLLPGQVPAQDPLVAAQVAMAGLMPQVPLATQMAGLIPGQEPISAAQVAAGHLESTQSHSSTLPSALGAFGAQSVAEALGLPKQEAHQEHPSRDAPQIPHPDQQQQHQRPSDSTPSYQSHQQPPHNTLSYHSHQPMHREPIIRHPQFSNGKGALPAQGKSAFSSHHRSHSKVGKGAPQEVTDHHLVPCPAADAIDYTTGVPETEFAASRLLDEVYDDAVVLSRTIEKDRKVITQANQDALAAKTAQQRFASGGKGRGKGKSGAFNAHQQLALQLRNSQRTMQDSIQYLSQVVQTLREVRDLSRGHGVRILKALRALHTSQGQRRAIAMTRQALNLLDKTEDGVDAAAAQINPLTRMGSVDVHVASQACFAVQRAHADTTKAVRDMGNAAKAGADTGGAAGTLQSAALKPLPGPAREPLPIDKHRERIVHSVQYQAVTCIQGETGCGKSSRVPQYVFYDVGVRKNKQIVVTQPRRLACITLAKRVAQEMGQQLGDSVGYRIAGDAADSGKTKLLFVTTGYLLQTLVNDPLKVNKFSHIILDEVHERSVEADLLTLVLKLVTKHKMASFSLILMSATLQGGLFANYFHDKEEEELPEPIFVGVKRFNLDILYLEDLFQLRRRFDRPDLAICVLDILRARSGRIMSEESSSILQEGLEKFQKSLEMAAKKKSKRCIS